MTPPPTPPAPVKKPFWQRWWFIAIVVVVVVGGLGNALGLGGSSTAPASPSPKATGAPMTSTAPATAGAAKTTAAAMECLPVSDALKEAIKSGLKAEDKAVIESAAAVKSPIHSDAYYVAARINLNDGNAPIVGVWGTSKLDGSGMMQSGDAFAKEFSNYPQKDFETTDKGAEAARKCLA